jgi:hypothetical protein
MICHAFCLTVHLELYSVALIGRLAHRRQRQRQIRDCCLIVVGVLPTTIPTVDTGRSHPHPLFTIRAAYTELGRSVDVALRTQMGDAAHLGVQRVDCLRLLALTEQVCVINDFAVEW